jgi:hypothetical protein
MLELNQLLALDLLVQASGVETAEELCLGSFDQSLDINKVAARTLVLTLVVELQRLVILSLTLLYKKMQIYLRSKSTAEVHESAFLRLNSVRKVNNLSSKFLKLKISRLTLFFFTSRVRKAR